MCFAPAPSRAIRISSRAATWRRANAKRLPCGSSRLWSAYTQDVTRARSLPATALKDFIAAQPASLQAVNGDMAKMALQRGLVTALKSRRQVADDLKGLVGEDDSDHSFNGIGMNQYLAAVRSKHALKSKSDAKVGIVVASGEIFDGRQLPGAIGGESTSDQLREARYDNSDKSGGVARGQSGRQRVRLGENPARSSGAAQIRQARGRFDEQLCRFGRLLHRGGGESNFCKRHHHHRIDRRVLLHPHVPAHAGKARRQGRRHRHYAARGRYALRSSARAGRPSSCCNPRSITLTRQFLRRVADGRKKSVEEVDKIAQGRVWAGADAQRIGLVDHLGGLKDATDAAAKLAQLGPDYEVDYIETELSLREQLLMQIRSQGCARGAVGGAHSAAHRLGTIYRPPARAGPRHRPVQGSARFVLVLLVPGANRTVK